MPLTRQWPRVYKLKCPETIRDNLIDVMPGLCEGEGGPARKMVAASAVDITFPIGYTGIAGGRGPVSIGCRAGPRARLRGAGGTSGDPNYTLHRLGWARGVAP